MRRGMELIFIHNEKLPIVKALDGAHCTMYGV